MNEMAHSDFEQMLGRALAPVDPPDRLKTRLESTLQEITDAAVDELEGWEIGAMRDPRNWGRPVAAILVGGTAAGALVLVRARQRHKSRPEGALPALGKGIRDVAGDIRKRVGG